MTKRPTISHCQRPTSPGKAQESFASEQGDLFRRLEAEPPVAADLDIHFELLGAITACLREARGRGLSREHVVARMNELLPEAGHGGKPAITKRQLDCWTANSREYSEFPARYLPAFCAAVESPFPLVVLARAVGRELVDVREAHAKRLGEAQIEIGRLRREARKLVEELGGE